MKIKTSELTDAALDHAVMQTLDLKNVLVLGGDISYEPFPGVRKYFRPSESWAQGGPIIEREGINIRAIRKEDHAMHGEWLAAYDHGNTGTIVQWVKREDWHRHYWKGPSALIAAMRCYVASKLGDEVEVPDGLA